MAKFKVGDILIHDPYGHYQYGHQSGVMIKVVSIYSDFYHFTMIGGPNDGRLARQYRDEVESEYKFFTTTKWKIGDKLVLKDDPSVTAEIVSMSEPTGRTASIKRSDRSNLSLTVLDCWSRIDDEALLATKYMSSECSHEWTQYTGLREVFEFCKKCDVRKT